MAANFEQDWAIVREAGGDLEGYLLSQELYWPLNWRPSSGAPVTQFTLGNLKVSLARLSAVSLTAERQSELEQIKSQVNTVRERWKANWARKAAREISARLKLWGNYTGELISEKGRRGAGYAYEVRWRVIIHLLQSEITVPMMQEEQALAALDAGLRSITTAGPFVWEDEVQPAFPESTYWYLYRKIRED